MDISELLFQTKKILSTLVLPPGGPLLCALVGLALARRWRRLGSGLAAAGVIALTLLACPPTADWLTRFAERGVEPLAPGQWRQAQAIVVLGGGVRRDAVEFGGDTVARFTLERIRYGAWLAHRSGLPVLVTGGAPAGGVPEALLMKASLEREFAVPVRWTESVSRDTRENASYSAAVLRTAGIRKVLLVTHGLHMRRAQAEFAAAGIDSIAAPTVLAGDGPRPWYRVLPDMRALEQSHYALHELLGEAVLSWSRH